MAADLEGNGEERADQVHVTWVLPCVFWHLDLEKLVCSILGYMTLKSSWKLRS